MISFVLSSREVSFVSQERKLRDVAFVTCLTERESSHEAYSAKKERKLRDVAVVTCLTQETSREVSVLPQKRARDVCRVFHASNRTAQHVADTS